MTLVYLNPPWSSKMKPHLCLRALPTKCFNCLAAIWTAIPTPQMALIAKRKTCLFKPPWVRTKAQKVQLLYSRSQLPMTQDQVWRIVNLETKVVLPGKACSVNLRVANDHSLAAWREPTAFELTAMAMILLYELKVLPRTRIIQCHRRLPTVIKFLLRMQIPILRNRFYQKW